MFREAMEPSVHLMQFDCGRGGLRRKINTHRDKAFMPTKVSINLIAKSVHYIFFSIFHEKEKQ